MESLGVLAEVEEAAYRCTAGLGDSDEMALSLALGLVFWDNYPKSDRLLATEKLYAMRDVEFGGPCSDGAKWIHIFKNRFGWDYSRSIQAYYIITRKDAAQNEPDW